MKNFLIVYCLAMFLLPILIWICAIAALGERRSFDGVELTILILTTIAGWGASLLTRKRII